MVTTFNLPEAPEEDPLLQARRPNKSATKRARTEAIFFMDIPLLFEQDYSAWFDETWLVYVDRDVQVERFMKRDYLSKEVAESRLATQWSLEEKKKLASHILDNNGSRDQLVTQVVKLLEGGDSCARD